MSIDARVETVYINEDGSGRLNLVDRPGNPPGISGQSSLWFKHAPEEVTGLNGLDVWGGSSILMLGDHRIASRVSYTQIVFVDSQLFKAALSAYHH
jgi:hypothetical protein